MTRRRVVLFTLFLTLIGAGWGATQPMTKMAVSTGYSHLGLVFWQAVIGATLMGVVCALRRTPVVLNRRTVRLYLLLAMIGTILPGSLSYQVAVHLPAGIMSLLLSTVPMCAFIIALPLGNDSFSPRRLGGLLVGLIGVLLILAPGVDLGQQIPVGWALIYLGSGMFYAFEGNYVARWGTEGLDPFQVMLGVSLASVVLLAPFMLTADHYITPVWPLPLPQLALAGSSIIHVLVYASYVWLVGQAGAIFAVQVSYLVTGFGLLWARVMLDEAYAPTLWLALAAMFVGMYLVQPRPRAVLAPVAPMREGDV